MKKKLTIKESLELMQKIRYYDQNGNIVYLMDEYEEVCYISDICKKYEGTSKEIIRKLKIASTLESMGLLNVRNMPNNEYSNSTNTLSPLIRIRRNKKQM